MVVNLIVQRLHVCFVANTTVRKSKYADSFNILLPFGTVVTTPESTVEIVPYIYLMINEDYSINCSGDVWPGNQNGDRVRICTQT
jgi:hypothetical protein